KIHHDLIQGQLVRQHHAVGGDVFEAFLQSALLFEQRQNAAEILVRRKNDCVNDRLFNLHNPPGVGHLRWRIDFCKNSVGGRNEITNARRRCNQIEIELALETLLNNLHVQQSEKATAETETQRG